MQWFFWGFQRRFFLYAGGMSIETIKQKIEEKLGMAGDFGASIKFDFGDDGVIL